MALLMHHAATKPDPPSLHNRSVNTELDDIVLRCLEKTPDARPSSALRLREQLLSVPLGETWNESEATSWWSDHLPETSEDASEKQAGPCDATVDDASGNEMDTHR